jgi:hypothetical protein
MLIGRHHLAVRARFLAAAIPPPIPDNGFLSGQSDWRVEAQVVWWERLAGEPGSRRGLERAALGVVSQDHCLELITDTISSSKRETRSLNGFGRNQVLTVKRLKDGQASAMQGTASEGGVPRKSKHQLNGNYRGLASLGYWTRFFI